MKGPGHRLRFDVRRIWECPICRRRERSGGHVVNRPCSCQAGKEPGGIVWMRLIEERSPVVEKKAQAEPAAVAAEPTQNPQAESQA